jgi:CheY-like chemotaxis protein
VASADRSFRQRLSEILTGLRWQVREVESGAEAWAEAEGSAPEAIIVDSWLPDLDLGEFLTDFRVSFPQVDLVTTGSFPVQESPRGPYRQELLYALRRSQDTDTAAWNTAPSLDTPNSGPEEAEPKTPDRGSRRWSSGIRLGKQQKVAIPPIQIPPIMVRLAPPQASGAIGVAHRRKRSGGKRTGRQQPVTRTDRQCALHAGGEPPHPAGGAALTAVLIEGPTGSGKELVAEALHRLSPRSRKPFVAINCAAIPEALLEAELFGHTRGAFTGAVQGRTGRIEAADGGTLFLDEIGEMPLALQSKLLRFVECGELQRVGDNETVKVDVRIVAATHRPLASRRSPAVSAPTSTTGWRSSSSALPRWGSMPRTCRCWWSILCSDGPR